MLVVGGLALATGPRARAELLNPSFEAVPSSGTGQGLLPSGWVTGANTSPGADTFSSDGSFGLAPGGFGHFSGASAADGLRWVAGADFGSGTREAFAQQLAATLTPGTAYTFRGSIRQSLDLAAGSYELLLSPEAAFNAAGAVSLGALAPTAGEDAWLARSLNFTAPANAGSLPFLVLAPLSATPGGFSYIGIDNLSLTTTTAIPEPSSLALAGLGAVMIGLVARWARLLPAVG
jgi:hypothetical protein